MKKGETYQWNTPQRQQYRVVASGDIRIVTLPVRCVFEWSDEIVADYDEETGHTEYTSGYVMKVLPNQNFVYKGEDSTFIAHATRDTGGSE
jgi:hypothetical protein